MLCTLDLLDMELAGRVPPAILAHQHENMTVENPGIRTLADSARRSLCGFADQLADPVIA